MSIAYALLIFVGIFSFLFFFWNRLKEDYTSLQIFSVAFYILIGIGAGFLLNKFLLIPKVSLPTIYPSGLAFWLDGLLGFVGFVIGIWRFKLKFFETLEAMSMGLLFLVLSVFVADTFIHMSMISLIAATVVALLIVLFYFLETRYKNFTWYKSGKVGFSGLTTVGLFFLVRGLVALKFNFVLTFLGRWESIVALALTFFIFLSVYNLSQRR